MLLLGKTSSSSTTSGAKTVWSRKCGITRLDFSRCLSNIAAVVLLTSCSPNNATVYYPCSVHTLDKCLLVGSYSNEWEVMNRSLGGGGGGHYFPNLLNRVQ